MYFRRSGWLKAPRVFTDFFYYVKREEGEEKGRKQGNISL